MTRAALLSGFVGALSAASLFCGGGCREPSNPQVAPRPITSLGTPVVPTTAATGSAAPPNPGVPAAALSVSQAPPPHPALPSSPITRKDELARVQALVNRIGPGLPRNTQPSQALTVLEARRVRFGDAERTLAAVRARDTTECFLVALDLSEMQGELLPGLDYTNCKIARWAAEDDLNGDGVVDLLYELILPSNRYPADVEEYAFYVSDLARARYCYAKALRPVLNVLKLPLPPGALGAAVRQYVAKRDQGLLRCANGPSSP